MIRAASATAAMLAAAAALAACGGSTPTKASQKTAFKGSGSALKLAHCMRTHGVPDFPDPSSRGGFGIQQSSNGSGGGTLSVDGHQLSVSAPAFHTAMQECQRFQPQGPPISGAQLAKLQKGALKMAECMRTHGVPNFPDPKVGTGPGGHGVGMSIGSRAGGAGQINPGSPAFQAANKICMPLMGGPKGFPTKKAGS
ncbi:MAG TPA: hypothetical protein VMV16_10020 [Solirubrobacteraceae bacterium]|nr:hypothetical protein [Solirubrobacteraceae bacterium]